MYLCIFNNCLIVVLITVLNCIVLSILSINIVSEPGEPTTSFSALKKHPCVGESALGLLDIATRPFSYLRFRKCQSRVWTNLNQELLLFWLSLWSSSRFGKERKSSVRGPSGKYPPLEDLNVRGNTTYVLGHRNQAVKANIYVRTYPRL